MSSSKGAALISILMLAAFLLSVTLGLLNSLALSFKSLQPVPKTEDSRQVMLGGISRAHYILKNSSGSLLFADSKRFLQPSWKKFRDLRNPCLKWSKSVEKSRVSAEKTCIEVDSEGGFINGNLVLERPLEVNAPTLAVAGVLRAPLLVAMAGDVQIVSAGDVEINQITRFGNLQIHSSLGRVTVEQELRVTCAKELISLRGFYGVEVAGKEMDMEYGCKSTVFHNHAFLGISY